MALTVMAQRCSDPWPNQCHDARACCSRTLIVSARQAMVEERTRGGAGLGCTVCTHARSASERPRPRHRPDTIYYAFIWSTLAYSMGKESIAQASHSGFVIFINGNCLHLGLHWPTQNMHLALLKPLPTDRIGCLLYTTSMSCMLPLYEALTS